MPAAGAFAVYSASGSCVGSGRVRLTVAERTWGQACPARAGHNIFFFLLLQGQQQRFRVYQRGEASQFPRQAVKETGIEAASPFLRALPSDSHLFLLDSRYGSTTP